MRILLLIFMSGCAVAPVTHAIPPDMARSVVHVISCAPLVLQAGTLTGVGAYYAYAMESGDVFVTCEAAHRETSDFRSDLHPYWTKGATTKECRTYFGGGWITFSTNADDNVSYQYESASAEGHLRGPIVSVKKCKRHAPRSTMAEDVP